MRYHILKIIAYLIIFVALFIIYAAIEDGLNNGIINNEGYLAAFIFIIIVFISSLGTIIHCNKKIKEIDKDLL